MPRSWYQSIRDGGTSIRNRGVLYAFPEGTIHLQYERGIHHGKRPHPDPEALIAIAGVFPVPTTMTAEDARPLLGDFKAFKTAIENREPPEQAIYDNPDAIRLLKHIESITVENGRLVIMPKSEE